MCGRYALHLRPSEVRHRLAEQNMPSDDAPEDDDERIRQTYNFAPSYHGLIYRAATGPDHGAGDQVEISQSDADDNSERPTKRVKTSKASQDTALTVDGYATQETKYKLQAAKWGLIPFWTKRPPDYGSQMRTINCRDDSLLQNGGMWNTMKQKKRCIVVAEGFYEWLKKNNGKEKIPHYVKRKDGELMCFAGLWDMVKYEGSEDKLYTYTVITTSSNKQINFLHDRMPVIMEPGSEAMKAWLDPSRDSWSKELQSMLKPFDGELECYPVDKAVGKVGNNSPNFVVPVNSAENKKNIANFFGSHSSPAKAGTQKEKPKGIPIKQDTDETRETDAKIEGTEDNAPIPKPKEEPEQDLEKAIKREASTLDDAALEQAADDLTEQNIKREAAVVNDEDLIKAAETIPAKRKLSPPARSPDKKPSASGRKMRSATSNNTVAKTPTKEGNAKITSFFGK